MGVATLVALSDRQRPEEVTREDLERFADYAQHALGTVALRSHASVLFTVNVPYLQPSFTPERRAANARQLLRAFAGEETDAATSCVYCGRAAMHLQTATGRAYRELVPLLTGQGTVNFAPYGQHGLSLCGWCVTALQALIIGAPNCEGRALIIAADDPEQVVAVIREWLPTLRARVQLSQLSGAKVDPWKAPRSRLVERLVQLSRTASRAERSTSFTIYHASNSGQGPDLTIYSLAAPAVAFAQRAQANAYRQAWDTVVQRGWHDLRRQPAGRSPETDEALSWRNQLFEDLFGLPESAGRFLRRHLAGPARTSIAEPLATAHVPLWDLARLFMEEILGMDQIRIQAIRDLGDALAAEIVDDNDRRLFRTVFQATRYPAVRRTLLGANSRRARRGEPPLLDFEGFLTVFEEGEEVERRDWRLAWDLMLIRLIDRLHEREWFQRNREVRQDLQDMENQVLAQAESEEDLPAAV